MSHASAQQLARHRVARWLLRWDRRLIGLSPCGRRVSVEAIAHDLGGALCLACDSPVALLTHSDCLSSLRVTLGEVDRCYGHVLVSLAGLRERGEQLAACDLLDGIVMLVHRGEVSEAELLAAKRDVDAERLMGVLMVG